jgi:hypothetical protein
MNYDGRLGATTASSQPSSQLTRLQQTRLDHPTRENHEIGMQISSHLSRCVPAWELVCSIWPYVTKSPEALDDAGSNTSGVPSVAEA